MTNYNYLKIDFYGQFNADTIHKFTYPEPYNPMGGSSQVWLNPITDPRALRTHFPMAKYAYRIHRDSNGIYYSYITKYEKDTRQGYVVITVMIGSQYELLINGKAIFNLLNLLKAKVLDTENFTAQAVEQCLAECRMPVQNVTPVRITPLQPLSAQAFRVYNTNDELIDIFQFPKQAEYEKYGEVFLVNKFWCNSSVPGVALLSSPIIKTYNVIKPASVSCDNSVKTGDTLNITYSKPGFAPLTVPVMINGISNQYMKYEGATLTILVPDNLPFKQRVNMRVSVNGISYSDSKVSASLGGEPLRYNPQLGAYSAEVSQQALSGSDIKLSVSVNDTSLEPYRSASRRSQQSSSPKWLLPLIAFLAGVLLAGGLTWFFMRDSGDSNSSAPVIENQNQPVDSVTLQNEEQDIKYMKENNVLKLDELKSEKYKQFFQDVKSGNIDAIVNTVNDLLSSNKEVNDNLVKLSKAVKSGQQDKVRSILAAGDNNVIDLEKLLHSIEASGNNEAVAPASDRDDDSYIPGSGGNNAARRDAGNINQNNANLNRNKGNNAINNNNNTNTENDHDPRKKGLTD